MKPEHVTFPCGKLNLEGVFFGTGSKGPLPAVVVCHPHPQYGGSMNNNVTHAIAGALATVTINAFLFNFRGVGASGGSYGGGIHEQQDVIAALDWLQKRPDVNPEKFGLAGYSFGAGVVFPVACSDERVKGFALVSPYFEDAQESLLSGCTKPKLIMGGSEDQVVSADIVLRYGRQAAEPKQVEIIKGPDHFWNGYEDRISETVAGFFGGLFTKNQGM
ncbi:MAG: dienelactone hydrolase family protein [Chloroflexi bacterium]|nr:dienelactone hydrolase family protein [Chloroflexota bacterium]